MRASRTGFACASCRRLIMRYISLAALTLAGVAFAGTAYPDSNNGPRQKGDQCWHRQLGDSLGYWAPCRSAEAEAVRQRLMAARRRPSPRLRPTAIPARGRRADLLVIGRLRIPGRVACRH